ncbi:DUF6603 domain-containing protein [Embleya sp. NPDC050154]|uniref:DUF6603 domain-containing protein n=1 Tax=Embleya sp. NPDC050154 TaxID=3363988 RepID=UPI0037A45689
MAAGTLELLAREIANALRPLEQRLAADRREAYFIELGLWLPGGLGAASGAIGTVAIQSGGLGSIVARLDAAIAADDGARITLEGVSLLGALRQVFDAITALTPALDAAVVGGVGLSDAQRVRLRAEVGQVPRRMLDHALLTHLEGRSRNALDVLSLLGIVMDVPGAVDPQDPTVLQVRRRTLRLDRLPTLFTAPGDLFGDVFDFGRPSFDGRELFRLIAEHLDAHDRDFTYEAPAGGPKALDAYVLRLAVDPSNTPPTLAARVDVAATEDYLRSYTPSPLWKLAVEARTRFEPGLEGHIRPPLSIELRPATGGLTLDAGLALTAEHADGKPIVLLGKSGGSRLEVGRLTAALGLKAQAAPGAAATVEPTAHVDLVDGHVLIDLAEGDGFIGTITGGGRVESDFTLRALWSPSDGLRLEGSGSLDLAIPTHLELGPVEVTTLYLSVGVGADGSLPLEISTGFTAELGPIKATVDRVGVIVSARFRDGGNLGPLDIGFAFKPPTGIGLSVDAGVVAGGGFLSVDSARGEYSGALELKFAGFLDLKAIGLISTRMPDGSDGFSMLIVITTEFGAGGLQLGYGFTLLAVGGLIGLNRGMNLTALAEGVRTGRVESVMFPKDVVANAPRILSDLRAFFPPEQGTFLIGPMAKIGWGTPTLVSVSLGVVIEIPGNLAVLGVLKCALPTEELALLVLKVAFIGAFEFDKSRLWFFAQLFESRILTMTLDGGMGLLVAWGDKPDLVLTVGGFHPAFKPPPLPFPVPKRLSIDILNRPGGLIRVSGYFALTSNTAQFGAAAELRFGFSDFGIEGHLAFDALFRFSPFAFVIEIGAGVSLKAFGVGVFGIDLRFRLEGPSPWRARGRGSISLLLLEISADFDIAWGEERNTTLPPIAVLPLLAREITKIEGWRTVLPPGGGDTRVTLRTLPDTDRLVLHPRGTLFVQQRAIPLNVRIDRVGAQRPSDGKRFTIAPASDSGLVQLSLPDDKFAMAQFQDMDDAAKLSAAAYQDQDAGLELSAERGALASARVVRRSTRYELHIFDSRKSNAAAMRAQRTAAAPGSTRRERFHNVGGAIYDRLLEGNSTSRSSLSRREAEQRQPFAAEDTVRITGQRYAVAYRRDNLQAFPPTSDVDRGATSFRSLASASDALADWVHADPSLANTLHVIPVSEVAAPLSTPGTWTEATALPVAASGLEAVRPGGGTVFVAGGADDGGRAIKAAALFDPARKSWKAAADLAVARRGHSTTVLDDGRVLVVGGWGADGALLASAEIFDPIAGTWSPAGTGPKTARARHSATLLSTGSVLVAGGTGARSTESRALYSAELFDPRTGVWSPAKAMTDARSGHRAAVLSGGRVLVVGGATATGGRPRGLAFCELYDPVAGTWSVAASLNTPRKGHQATTLADGSVLVTGGDATEIPAAGRFTLAPLASAERYDPGTNAWAPVANMPGGGRSGHRALLLRSGRVLVSGGSAGSTVAAGLRSTILYDPVGRVWTSTGGLGGGRTDFAAIELADGRVLAAGGVVLAGPAAPTETVVVTAGTEILTP